jgi:hypothetical protein
MRSNKSPVTGYRLPHTGKENPLQAEDQNFSEGGYYVPECRGKMGKGNSVTIGRIII